MVVAQICTDKASPMWCFLLFNQWFKAISSCHGFAGRCTKGLPLSYICGRGKTWVAEETGHSFYLKLFRHSNNLMVMQGWLVDDLSDMIWHIIRTTNYKMQLYSFPYWYLLWINLCDKTRQTEKQLHLHSRTHTHTASNCSESRWRTHNLRCLAVPRQHCSRVEVTRIVTCYCQCYKASAIPVTAMERRPLVLKKSSASSCMQFQGSSWPWPFFAFAALAFSSAFVDTSFPRSGSRRTW